MRIVIKRFVAICATLLFVTVVGAISVGWMLGHPVQVRIGDPPADLNAEPINFESDSGANVHGWWCAVKNSRGAVLLLPGIRANRLSMVDRARFLHRAGYSVLLIDFQATGETKGDRITFGWKESRDAIAAVSFIRNAEPASRVAVIGSSLGGVATLLATPPLKLDALILEAVYPTIEIATTNRELFRPIGAICGATAVKTASHALGYFSQRSATDRSHCQCGLSGIHHKRQRRPPDETERYRNLAFTRSVAQAIMVRSEGGTYRSS